MHGKLMIPVIRRIVSTLLFNHSPANESLEGGKSIPKLGV